MFSQILIYLRYFPAKVMMTNANGPPSPLAQELDTWVNKTMDLKVADTKFAASGAAVQAVRLCLCVLGFLVTSHQNNTLFQNPYKLGINVYFK